MPLAEENRSGPADGVPDVGEAGEDVEVGVAAAAAVAVHRVVIAQRPVAGIGIVERREVVRVVGGRGGRAWQCSRLSPGVEANNGR